MFRYSLPPEVDEASAVPTSPPTNDDASTATDQNSHSIRDRLRFKRNTNHLASSSATTSGRGSKSREDRASRKWHHHHGASRRKSWFTFRGVYLFYFAIVFTVFGFAMGAMLLQSSITSMMFSRGWNEQRRSVREGMRLGTTLKFVPGTRSRRLVEGPGLDQIRMQQAARVGLRPPRLAFILGNVKKNPQLLMLVTIMKNLRKLGYALQIYAPTNGRTQSILEQTGGQISILPAESYNTIDWSMFDGIIMDSLQAGKAMARSLSVQYQLSG